MATKESVLEALADALPLDLELGFYNVSTPPTPSPALFSAPPGQAEEKTFCETHFLAASSSEKDASRKTLLLFAIEVLVFTTQNLTTVFVSKADSTGYLHILKIQPGVPSIIQTICTTFLSYLVKQRLDGPRVVVSLFARSQNQYLFPGSVENSGKHVLDDRQLIKWWCRTLDPILRDYEAANVTPDLTGGSKISSEAFIIVPGCDRLDTRAFFPPSTKSEATSRWSNSYPRDLIVPDGSAPPRCVIPRFPDDPKARFLDELDSEISGSEPSSTGNWKSVKSLEQFWEMMSYRQECSAGRLVGFIWVVITQPQPTEISQLLATNGSTNPNEQSGLTLEQLPTPNQSQINSLDSVLPHLPLDDDKREPIQPASSPPPSSPLLPPTDDLNQRHSEKQDEAHQELFYNATNATPVSSPFLLLSSPHYETLTTHLLSSDFATQDLATQSTSTWIKRASELAGISDWGGSVMGRKPIIPVVQSKEVESREDVNVNVLTGIRRKKRRKLDGGGGGG